MKGWMLRGIATIVLWTRPNNLFSCIQIVMKIVKKIHHFGCKIKGFLTKNHPRFEIYFLS